MRQYRPLKTVVAALKRSTFLTITDDDCIVRTIPISEETMSLASNRQAASSKAQNSGKKKKKKDGGGAPPPPKISAGKPGMSRGMVPTISYIV